MSVEKIFTLFTGVLFSVSTKEKTLLNHYKRIATFIMLFFCAANIIKGQFIPGNIKLPV